jgi:hypothetical protein
VALGLDDVEEVVPLGGSRVYAGGVVGAHVQENDTVVLGVLQVFGEACVVEALGLGVVVTVVLPFSADNFDESSVKWPGRVWHENVNVLVGIPVSEELEAETEGTSAGNGLGGGDSSFLYLFVVGAVSKGQTLGDVRVDTLDSSVLVIHVKIKDLFFSTTNTFENKRLRFVTSVDSHTEKLLFGIGLLLESFIEAENGIWWSSSNT